MNNEQNNNEKVIVTPELVDLNKVQVGNEDTMLNRERSNIVSAAIQANDAIDEKKALNVNNEIKIKKVNIFKRILSILLCCIIAGIGIYFVMQLVNKIMTYGDEEETQITTTAPTSPKGVIKQYAEDVTKVRKFQSEEHILILSPVINGSPSEYVLITISPSGFVEAKHGTYTLTDRSIDTEEGSYEYVTHGILLGHEELEIKDEEMKYYKYADDNKVCFLIVNGTVLDEYAMYIEYANGIPTIISSKFVESPESITFESGEIFTKVDMTVSFNGTTLEYVI